jgi:plastocyanin
VGARLPIPVLALAAAVPALTACGGGPDAAAVTPPPSTHTVTMEAVSFKPDAITVRVGDSIVWVNKDPFPHTASAAGTFDSKELLPEKSWTFTAAQPGEVQYVCTYHPTMKGTIVVK